MAAKIKWTENMIGRRLDRWGPIIFLVIVFILSALGINDSIELKRLRAVEAEMKQWKQDREDVRTIVAFIRKASPRTSSVYARGLAELTVENAAVAKAVGLPNIAEIRRQEAGP